MKPIVYSEHARKELKEIVRYYEKHRKGLGRDFRSELGEVVESIRRTPQAFSYDPLTETRKRAMKRFPYLVHYLDEAEQSTIVAIPHQRRRSGYWLPESNGHPASQ